MFCTNKLWPELIKDNQFFTDFKNHISTELALTHKNKTGIISRSGDKTQSVFLRKLQQAKQNNSIIINEFFHDRIEVTYFMADPDFPSDRDRILNHLEQLKLIKNSLDVVLRKIQNSQEFHAKKVLLLTQSSVDAIWGNSCVENKPINVLLENRQIQFTFRELECLSILRFGASNMFIAEALKISVETVKSHLQSIKYKSNSCSRKQLIEIAKQESLTNILNIISTR